MIQRFAPFGCAINLNLDLHMVALDGVYTKDGETLRFHEVSAPYSAEMQRLLDAIVSRVLRCLEHDGLLIRDPDQPWLGLGSRDALGALGAASIQYRIAVRCLQLVDHLARASPLGSAVRVHIVRPGTLLTADLDEVGASSRHSAAGELWHPDRAESL